MEKVVRLDLDSGVTLDVAPLSPFVINAINKKAGQLYPVPPPPKVPVPNSVIEGETYADTDDPEWQEAARQARQLQSMYAGEQVILLSVSVANQDALVKKYAARLKQLSQVIDLPEDAWQATLLHCIITSDREVALITMIARDRAPLTEEEIADGVTYFRVKRQRDTDTREHAARGVQTLAAEPE